MFRYRVTHKVASWITYVWAKNESEARIQVSHTFGGSPSDFTAKLAKD
jgi:hypothetical protein